MLRATADLLRTATPAELSVAQIVKASGTSRSSFYEHFASKDDVVVALVKDLTARAPYDMVAVFEPSARPVEEALRAAMQRWLDGAADQHRIWLAASESWPRVPAIRAVWFGVSTDMTDLLAPVIERERAAGHAPPGADARGLAASLLWATERAFHVALFGGNPLLRGVPSIVEPLVQLWVGSIYGRAVAPPAGADASGRP